MAENEEYARFADVKLFGKWSYDEVIHNDMSLKNYIAVIKDPKVEVFIPHTAGRFQTKRFRKASCPIVERMVNSLMAHGRNSGKKAMAVRIVKHALDVINLLTGRNPLQVLVEAVENGGPREDSCRVGSAGVVRQQAVDVSPLRRVNKAVFMMCAGARDQSFRSIKTIAECLANEIINASKASANSYAIKKKDEVERAAKNNR